MIHPNRSDDRTMDGKITDTGIDGLHRKQVSGHKTLESQSPLGNAPYSLPLDGGELERG
jgi:hypothetical protein